MIKAVRGFKDILPGETEKWVYLEGLARRFFNAYGFREIRTPILEKTELFARSIGEATDIVEKEMYTFLDRNKESVTLRPEATAGICRAVIEHGLYAKAKVLKLFTMGPMFRHERPQKGRLRQFHQFNAEVFGSHAPGTDAEVIALAMDILQAGGAKDLRLEINSLGCPECRPAFRENLRQFLRKNADKLCEDCKRRTERNPLRALDCKKETCQAVYENAPLIEEFWCEECRKHFAKVLEELGLLGLEFVKNPRLVRGLDYYVRTTFEIKAQGLGAQDTVAAGGRYDGLLKALGGPDIPGVGFAIGVERFLLVADLPANLEPRLDLFVAALGEEAKKQVLPLVRSLRNKSISVDLDHEGRSLKAQLKVANRLKARYALILGENELKEGVALLRDMETGEQESISLSELEKELIKRLS
ncbi:histidine--tRNA ligase [Thermodesulfatator autotrophicus]|uniref:Histidine--tRNA ligase n=1 Tax=Thermodesulfatator autotrophicus TaxID=1795632 RepID=A0A177E751_9BACT|nr:histidine--tRNA ligase [Thermodesulfatator autotrophicus]OAG27321.1 histidine--tRNA ligase [Thermodesulfatator autotrophicus]